MSTNVKSFLELLNSQVNRGIYVWGGNGQALNAMSDPIAWIERREENPENEKRDIALFEKRKKDGVNPIQAFDCSGLVYWALRSLGLQKKDLSSRGFYNLCKHIDEKDLKPGDLVFHHDGTQIVHVGVCVGNEQIECKGRDVGVVKNKRKAGYWNRFGRLPYFEIEPTPEPEPVHEPGYVIKVRGSVRVRNGNGILHKTIAIVRNCTLPYLGQDSDKPNWYITQVNGVQGWITSNPKYTSVEEAVY